MSNDDRARRPGRAGSTAALILALAIASLGSAACTVPEYAFDGSVRDAEECVPCGADGECYLLSSDPDHCGACDHACPNAPNTMRLCVAAVCTTPCRPGFGDCNHNPADGCEADINSPATCGASCAVCAPAPNADAVCNAQQLCERRCRAGYADCNGDLGNPAGNGCETRVSDDASNCGSCRHVCPTTGGATAVCTDGTCGFVCATGTEDCDHDPSNGCEVSLSSNVQHCGNCSTACTPPAVCVNGSCTNSCPTTFTRCSDSEPCVDLQSDPLHCGGCTVDTGGHVCTSAANAEAACSGGACGVVCLAGYANCNNNLGDGCEARLRTTANCLTCGDACAAPANATASCTASGCAFACNAGHHLCNGQCPADTDVNACGAACVMCPVPAGGTATCNAGACGFTCNVGYHQCGQSCASNTSPNSCGASCTPCSAPANAAATCSAGACGFTCNAGYHQCGTNCAANTDVNACGASCTRCTAPANATAACSNGACTFACNAGYHQCGTSCASNTSVSTCGTSCTPCAAPANGTATCNGSACGFTCNAGYHQCGTNCAANTDVNACGASCTRCTAPANGAASCSNGACAFACNAGYYADINGGCSAVGTPTLFTPISTSTVTSPTPTLGWNAPSGGVRVQICSDRACGSVVAQYDFDQALGARVPSPLNPGVYFWRAYGRVPGTMSLSLSPTPTWQFRVVARAATTANTFAGADTDWRGAGRTAALVGQPIAPTGAQTPQFRIYRQDPGGSFVQANIITAPGGNTEQGFGAALAPAGDVNGDGLGDVIVGACAGPSPPSAVNCSNQIHVYHGTGNTFPTAPATTIAAPSGAAGFGYAVSNAGDVFGDGYGDVIVGAYYSNDAYVYYGSAGGIVNGGSSPVHLSAAAACPACGTPAPGTPLFGVSVASADVNGDRLTDVIVGAPLWQRVFVYFGQRGVGISATPSQTLQGPAGSNFGLSVANAGDVNGDGYSDVIVGGNGANNNTAQVFLGGASGLNTTPQFSKFTPVSGGDQFGVSVAGAGDVNGDGYADVAIGSSGTGGATPGPGYVYIYRGGPSGIVYNGSLTGTDDAMWRIGSSSGTHLMGRWVAGSGDINADGYADVTMGACSQDIPPDGGGTTPCNESASVFFGRTTPAAMPAGGVTTTPNSTFTGGAGTAFGEGVAVLAAPGSAALLAALGVQPRRPTAEPWSARSPL